MSVRVAVVGAGYLGRHHARIFAELDGAELAGVVDIDLHRAREVADGHSSAAYTDYRDVLNKVDALSIVVPTSYHYDIALECLKAGKDLFMEKPVTVTLDQAIELINAAERMSRIFQVGHLERYNQGFVALSGMVNKPVFLEAVRQSPFLGRAADVDVTIDLMIHDIDIVLSLVPSPITNIKAEGSSSVTDKIDEAAALIEFKNGTTAYLRASRTAADKQRRLRVFQKDSCLELDFQEGHICRYHVLGQDRGAELRRSAEARSRRQGSVNADSSSAFDLNLGEPAEIIKPEYREPLKEELKDFISCVISRERPKVSGIEGMNALKVALEINSLIGVSA